MEKERTDEVLAVPEDDKQPQLVHPTINIVLFCLAYKSAGFCSVNTITLCIRFVTANHRGISARNVPVLTVLLYIQYPLPWYSHKSCPRPRYYCGNFPEFFFPFLWFSRGNILAAALDCVPKTSAFLFF